MKRFHRDSVVAAIAICICVSLAGRPCVADVRLPHIFGRRMVLQRDLPVRVWGTADPGEEVTVSIDGKQANATADGQGKWKVELPALAAGKPVEIKVAGKNTITLSDVLVGEVWVCSGQSNMQMSVLSSNNAKEEIAAARYPDIRLITVPMRPAGEPAADFEGEWKRCTPGNIPPFSAVAYFFGRHLHQELGVPVGLINTSWGGTRIEPWTPPVGFRAVSSLASTVDEIEKQKAGYQQAIAVSLDQFATWLGAQKAKESGAPISPPPSFPAHPLNSNLKPTGLFNGMIQPLVPFAIRGAIWYQGESNLSDGQMYQDKMTALISGWRSVWNQGDFPFLFVQLASFHYGNPNPTLLPRIWEAQSETLSVANTGMAVTNDVSDIRDIHPKNKQDVGKRLALWALAKTYGKNGIVYSGPSYKSMSVEDSRVRLKFDSVGGGIVSRDGKPLSWFTIAGEDKKFVPAVAEVDGDSIVVSTIKVAKPVAVRFAWDQDAEPNLSNKDGLPASAFRTDRW